MGELQLHTEIVWRQQLVTKYRLYEISAAASSGHWFVNGVAHCSNALIETAAAPLSLHDALPISVSDTVGVQAFDGTGWSPFAIFHVNPPINHLPVVTAADFAAARSQG